MSDATKGFMWMAVMFVAGRLSAEVNWSGRVMTMALSIAGTLLALSLVAHFHGKKTR